LTALFNDPEARADEAPTSSQDGAKENNSTAEKAVAGWTLDDCLRIALEHNFDIRKAKERIEKQYNVKLEARAFFLPSIGFEGNFDTEDKKRLPAFGGETFGSDKNWTVDIKARQAVYSGGKGTADYRRAKFQEEAAREDLQAVINDVLTSVKELYYDALLAAAEVEVEQQNVTLYEEQLKSERSKLSAGTVSDFNVLRAEVDLANSKTPLIRAKNQVTLSQEELRRALGVGSEGSQVDAAGASVRGDLTFEPYTVDLHEALAQAESRRPELKSAKLMIDAEGQGIESERAGYFPTVSVYASYGADKSRFTNELDDEYHGWTAGAEANWNFFDGLRTSSRVEQARSAQSQARLTFEQTKQDINVEVRRVYSSLIESQELVRASNKVSEQAAESLRLARARYDTGAATYLDVLDTQVALTQARTNQIQALHDYNVVVAKMRRAVGSVKDSPAQH
jgi:TolC family type I secretion outer membrane protein